jgi:L-ribulose-5-phosphate 3-epimerase
VNMLSRREFIASVGIAAVGPGSALGAQKLPFHLSVITDEISQDFERACAVASREFGLQSVELRAMHDKNIINWDSGDIAEVRRILARYHLSVSQLASPVFKTDWPGAPKSPSSPTGPQFGASFTYEQQPELLDHAIDLAKTFRTPYVRMFDFWRLEDQTPYRRAIDNRLREAAVLAGKKGVTLTIENELDCNTATGAEASRLLNAVTEPALMLNWDPGNAAARGEKPFPDGYARLPKHRIAYVHCKDLAELTGGKKEWAAMGKGIIDWAGQFRALAKDGYRGTVSLETHWTGGGTPEESTRQSMAGMNRLLESARRAVNGGV